jgi:multidrug transporter EmrE-like cation transporter
VTYLFLLVAIVFETGWAIAMKLSDGFQRPGPTAAMAVMYVLSLIFLGLATRRLEVGSAYALWAGAGASLIAIAGILWFKEPATVGRLVSLALVAAGIIGLRLSGGIG